MRKSVLTAAVAAALATPMLASAQVTGNMSLVSDYRFRGLTQTFEEPALQGGFDYAHASGIYLGNWNSSISDTFYAGAPLEMDFYGGYKGSYGDFGFDVGALYYYYPGSDAPSIGTIDNLEIYAGVSWKFLNLKYFYAVSDFFGLPDSDGSDYIDLTGTWDVGNGWALVGHIGHQRVKNLTNGDYTDYKIGVTKDLGGWVFGAAFIDTDADASVYTTTSGGGKTKNLGDSTVVLSISKTF
ncbi:MAG TPA: TorF family putative porin [Burkholderiales bacterium]|nr:TorF family putative porin [Burkholderiales bacterium]